MVRRTALVCLAFVSAAAAAVVPGDGAGDVQTPDMNKNSAGRVNPTTPAETAAAVGHLAEASGVNIHDDKKADVVTAGAATAAAGMHATAELDGTHREAPKKADFDDAAAGAKHAEAPNKHHSPAVTQQRIAGEDSSAYIVGSTGEEMQRMQAA